MTDPPMYNVASAVTCLTLVIVRSLPLPGCVSTNVRFYYHMTLNHILGLRKFRFCHNVRNIKIAIRGDGKSPDQKVIDMQLQAANLVYIFDVIILSVTANKSGRLTVETSFLPLNSSKGGTLKCKP